MNFQNYTHKTVEDALRSLGSNFQGLGDDQVLKARSIYGANETKIKRQDPGQILARQLRSAFFYLLIIAAAVAFSVGERSSALLVLLFLSINTGLAFYQEYRANKVVQALERHLSQKACVVRSGKTLTVDKAQLVPGDIVTLAAGSIIPADLRVVSETDFCVDESLVTGESEPVRKSSGPLYGGARDMFGAKNIAFAGTLVVSGRALGLVIATGLNTAAGTALELASSSPRHSAYERNLARFANFIYKSALALVVVTFVLHVWLRGTANFYDYLVFCIALAVGLIPEALPVVVAFGLAQGALRLSRDHVVVKRLSAIEDLGDVNVLCTDKTGTLTKNKLTLEMIYARDEERCLTLGLASFKNSGGDSVLCNPFDTALTEKCPKKIARLLKEYSALKEISFDSVRMRSSVLLARGRAKILVVKGAPEAIIGRCNKFWRGVSRESLEQEIKAQGARGRRVIALAAKRFTKKDYSVSDECDLEFVGFFAFDDPLKPTSKAAIEMARKLRVAIKIITGDSAEVAAAVGREVGLVDNDSQVITGSVLEALAPQDFEDACLRCRVFARTTPAVKYRIVESLARSCEVGFLGEGVNDVPPLKAANVGLVVSEATDVAKAEADIVILNRDLKVIIEGIRLGRTVFSNVQKYIKCNLASNSGTAVFMALASLAVPFLPMLPLQILLINLLSDIVLIAIIYDVVEPRELLAPKSYHLRQMLPLAGLLAIVSVAFGFAFLAIFGKVMPAEFQTLWFIASIAAQTVLIFSVRTSRLFWRAARPSVILVALAVLTTFVAVVLPFLSVGKQAFGMVVPGALNFTIMALLVLVYFLVSDMVKLAYYRFALPGDAGDPCAADSTKNKI